MEVVGGPPAGSGGGVGSELVVSIAILFNGWTQLVRHLDSEFYALKLWRGKQLTSGCQLSLICRYRVFGNADRYATDPRSDWSAGRREFRHSALREDAAKRQSRNRYRQIVPGQ